MNKFTKHQGLTVPLDVANIDTDQIIAKQFLSRITRDGFGVNLFHDWRYLDEAGEQANPEFNLNKPKFKGGSILLVRENFGCGSSREHAPWALADFGFKVIIAPSFADIFYGNAINNGLIPVRLTESEVDQLFAQTTEGAQITVDLEQLTVTAPDGTSFDFTIDQFQRECLINGLDSIGWTLQHLAQIEDYEQSIPAWRR